MCFMSRSCAWFLFNSSLAFGNNLNEEDRKKYCETKKDAKRIVYMAMDQKV